jgi:hypothetical protein
MNLENLVDVVERNAERTGQMEQQKEYPVGRLFVPRSLHADVVDIHNRQLAERVAALSPELRAARATAIANQ